MKGSLAYQASLNAARVPAQVDSPGLAAVSYGFGSPLRSCVSESKDKQPISPIGHTHVFLHELHALQQINRGSGAAAESYAWLSMKLIDFETHYLWPRSRSLCADVFAPCRFFLLSARACHGRGPFCLAGPCLSDAEDGLPVRCPGDMDGHSLVSWTYGVSQDGKEFVLSISST